MTDIHARPLGGNGEDFQTSGSPRADEDKYAALGRAVVNIWSGLPQGVQHQIFEAAVEFGGTSVPSDEMARFLHDRHPKTADSIDAES